MTTSAQTTAPATELNSRLPEQAERQLVEEAPIAITLNGIHFSVMLASPYDLEDFAFGYLLSERIIHDRIQIRDVESSPLEQGIQLNVTLSNRQLQQFKHQQRQLKGTSGCGLCGKQAMALAFPVLDKLPLRPCLPKPRIQQLKSQLSSWQLRAKSSGAMHAAFWVNGNGDILSCREDIGRHNAVDKLIGHGLRKGFDRHNASILVTSRCSVEIVQKAILCGVATLISLASPTRLAVEYARQHHLNLVHIPKKDAPSLYTAGTFE
ncbi:formate dehydrogenase accessory sulfurtransferase FdhD [Alteromonas aestuariivivens]|uniref:Sulfur carrier protein FdhD n=1 Tax=Alteromonas aestuariivivens TaxID=1938339 RepID=A0A3D8M6D7_9ALTE|nr:formate dehydrogenase accessory sulfurtransferase FdhD [Alteromonas aestuariivivens]RDV25249.1 formate dehydrogenase accessory sulfurtransferase FdhD [Alteromonas aestuariivivens]